jgi:hypothetical protein
MWICRLEPLPARNHGDQLFKEIQCLDGTHILITEGRCGTKTPSILSHIIDLKTNQINKVIALYNIRTQSGYWRLGEIETDQNALQWINEAIKHYMDQFIYASTD